MRAESISRAELTNSRYAYATANVIMKECHSTTVNAAANCFTFWSPRILRAEPIGPAITILSAPSAVNWPQRRVWAR